MKMEIDRLGLMASNTLHINNICIFFNATEQWYITIKDVIDNSHTEPFRKAYTKLLEQIELDRSLQNRRALKVLLGLAKQFYSEIVTELQSYDFFFRMGTHNPKGLRNISLFNDSIFGKFKNKEEDDNSG